MKPVKIYSRSIALLGDSTNVDQTIEFDNETNQYKITETVNMSVVTFVSIDQMVIDKQRVQDFIDTQTPEIIAAKIADAHDWMSAIPDGPVIDNSGEDTQTDS